MKQNKNEVKIKQKNEVKMSKNGKKRLT
jgi:hypothetical protein